MDSYVRAILPYLHQSLVSAQALSRIRALAKLLPISSIAGFECPLGPGVSQVDFQIGISSLRNRILIDSLAANSILGISRQLCQEWADGSSYLFQNVGALWFEFDLELNSSLIPVPCIFFSLKPEREIGVENQLISKIYGLLGLSLDPYVDLMLHQCIGELPAEAQITHIGLMLSRPSKEIRLIIHKIPPYYLIYYLEKNNWKGLETSFLELIKRLPEFVDSIDLAIDITQKVNSRIGLECSFPAEFDNKIKWRLFIDYLVEEEICTPEKRTGLLNWPGFTKETDYPKLWPDNLSLAAFFLGANTSSIIWRRINHIKIVYEQGKSMLAKGYLSFGHSWIDSKKNSK